MASSTHFQGFGFGLCLETQVLGLGLEAYKFSKLSCARFEDIILF